LQLRENENLPSMHTEALVNTLLPVLLKTLHYYTAEARCWDNTLPRRVLLLWQAAKYCFSEDAERFASSNYNSIIYDLRFSRR
jgi:hypothetical protein